MINRNNSFASNALSALAKRFPQLYLKPYKDCSQSELYRSIVRRGLQHTGTLEHFMGSKEDKLWMEDTPVGSVDILYLANREDFETCYQILGYRCEPKAIPATTGAVTLIGLNDWSRIHEHLDAYEASGGTDRSEEMKRFTSDARNYKTTIILLSGGDYSAIPAEQTVYSKEQWKEISYKIRQFHELTHFVCRSKYPELKHAIFDEVLADCIGLVYAVGCYDISLARAFLGIDENGQYIGGRLKNYLTPEQSIRDAALSANQLINELVLRCESLLAAGITGFDLMISLEEQSADLISLAFPSKP